MISTFVLLTVVGGVCRLSLNWVVRRKFGVSLGLPPILALALIILTGLPDILSPVSINLPLSLIHISEPTRLGMISYAVFCLKKKKERY